MPSTVSSLLEAAGLVASGVVPWGTEPTSTEPGVYVVAMSPDADEAGATLEACPIDVSAVDGLLDAREELRLDGARPEATALARRVGAFWLPDETILYIGLAGTSLAGRVADYYRTPLGARSPHAGGWFLKLLSNLDHLHVHYAEADDPARAEHSAIGAFVAAVSEEAKAVLLDPEHPFPFANLVWGGARKAHGITGARAPRLQGARPRESGAGGRSATPRPAKDVDAINALIQSQLRLRGQAEATAVEAARWLDEAGLLKDSASRPGLPLRDLLHAGSILGQRQEPNRRWFIDRLG